MAQTWRDRFREKFQIDIGFTYSSKIESFISSEIAAVEREMEGEVASLKGHREYESQYAISVHEQDNKTLASLRSDIVRLRAALRRNAESVPRYETHGHFCGYRTLYEATKQRSKEALTPSSPKTVERYREKDGRLIHDGDCRFWSWKICTCGLLHWLAPQIPKDEWFYQESAEQEKALGAPTTVEKEI